MLQNSKECRGSAAKAFHWVTVALIVVVRPMTSLWGYGFFAHIHVWAVWAGAILLTVHVVAALLHYFGRNDNVLHRMWPLATAQDRSRRSNANEGHGRSNP